MGRGVLALLWSVVVRDEFPESFPSFHVALFNAKHDDLRDIDDVAGSPWTWPLLLDSIRGDRYVCCHWACQQRC